MPIHEKSGLHYIHRHYDYKWRESLDSNDPVVDGPVPPYELRSNIRCTGRDGRLYGGRVVQVCYYPDIDQFQYLVEYYGHQSWMMESRIAGLL